MTRCKLIGLGLALCLAAAVLVAQSRLTPMNVKTGLWQTTSIIKMSGSLGLSPEMASKLTPEQRAQYEAAMKQYASHQQTIASKRCVTKEQLGENPFDQSHPQNMKCSEKLIRSTSSDAEIRQTCTGQDGSESDIHMMIHAQDREHVNGSGQVVATMGGHTMKSDVTFQSKWAQDTCPKDAE